MKPPPVNALTVERNGNTSEERYEAILRKGRDGIVVINKAGIIQSFNPAAQKMFGYEPAEVLGRSASMLMPKNCTGRGWYLPEGEVMACRKDRTLFPVELSVAQWSDNGDNYFTAIIRDLTERKAAEERRREEEAKYRAIIDTAVDGIAVIDEHGIIQSFNGAAERLFGYRAEEVIGKNIRLLMPEPYRNEHDEYIASYKRTGIAKVTGIGREVSGCRKDNTIFPLEIAIAEWCSEGHRFFAGTMRDISHRKKAEERAVQAERMQALGQLAGGIAHDFNNVLQAIFSAVDQTKALPANADTAQRAVQTIARAAERGASVTERLLAFARRSEFKAEVFDMTKVLNDVVGLLSQTLGAAITHRVEIETPLPPVFADKGRLETVLINLAVNARDAMPSGGILTLSVCRTLIKPPQPEIDGNVLTAGRYIQIRVSDTGTGMDITTLKHATEPFFTTKPPGKGIGSRSLDGEDIR